MTLARRITGLQRGPGAFSPADVAGLMRWYDASDGSFLFTDTGLTTPVASDGDEVKGWQDLSPNTKDVFEGTNAPVYKTAIQNGLDVVRFTAANSDTLNYNVGSAISQPWTAVFVIEQTMPGANAYFSGGGGSMALGMDASGRWTVYMGSGFITGSTDRSGAWHVVTVIGNGASSAIYNDGSSEASGDPGTQGWSNSAPRLGTHAPGGPFGTVDIGEVVIYDSALGSTDRGDVESYLKDKWGTP